MLMEELFKVGDVIEGFCNGYFGRNDYNEKVCVMVSRKYAVFQYVEGDEKGYGTILNLSEGLTKETVEKWKK